MADYVHTATDKKLAKIERKLTKEYTQAYKDMEAKLSDFWDAFDRKEQAKRQAVHAGEITQEEYVTWLENQMYISKRWEEMRDTLAEDLNRVNRIACSIINAFTPDAYAIGHNYGTFEVEKSSRIDTSYTLYDRDTVERLIRSNPDLLPVAKNNVAKDLKWNKQKLNSAILQGILQGENLPTIAKRLRTVSNMDKSIAIRNARTMMTGAENAGRYDSYKRAKGMGIEMEQMWMATLDGRTRHSHRQLDGERIKIGDKWHHPKFSNKCRYPGDPEGPPSEVYNCRCTMVGVLAEMDFDAIDLSQRNSRLGTMTYDEWKKGKSPTKKPAKVKKIDLSKYSGSMWIDGTKYDIHDLYKKDFDEVYDILSKEYSDVGLSSLFSNVDGSYDPEGLKKFLIRESQATKVQPKVTKAVKPPKVAKPPKSSTRAKREISYIDDLVNKTSIPRSVDDIVNIVSLNRNVTKEEAMDMLTDAVKNIVDKCDFGIRIKYDDFKNVLYDGRFKNLFETGHGGGSEDTGVRERLERNKFNVPSDADHSDRPIYGMLCPKYDGSSEIKDYYHYGPGRWYGDGIMVTMKKDNVINNATLTLGDSLDYGTVGGMEANNPIFNGFGYAWDTDRILKFADIGDMTNSKQIQKSMMDVFDDGDFYVEHQLHGLKSHSIDNIEKVYIEKSTINSNSNNDNDKLFKMLDKHNIPYEIIQ